MPWLYVGFTFSYPLSFGSFHTVLIYFAVVWVGSLFGFGGSVTEIEHKGLHDQLWRRKSMTLFGLHFWYAALLSHPKSSSLNAMFSHMWFFFVVVFAVDFRFCFHGFVALSTLMKFYPCSQSVSLLSFLDSYHPVQCNGWYWEMACFGWWGKSELGMIFIHRIYFAVFKSLKKKRCWWTLQIPIQGIRNV